MKKISLFLFFVIIQFSMAERPRWTYNCPKVGNSTYYYIVEHEIGVTEAEARNTAYKLVLQSAENALGVVFDSKTMNILSTQNNIPIRKKCEYTERLGNKYEVWLLYQVAKTGNIVPIWDEFNDCHKMNINFQPIWRSFLFSGWGQVYNHENTKGIVLIGSEIALLGSTFFTLNQSNNYLDKSKQSFDYKTKKYYLEKYNDWKIYRNALGIGSLAVWLINVIDISRPKKPHEQAYLEYPNVKMAVSICDLKLIIDY